MYVEIIPQSVGFAFLRERVLDLSGCGFDFAISFPHPQALIVLLNLGEELLERVPAGKGSALNLLNSDALISSALQLVHLVKCSLQAAETSAQSFGIE